MPCGDLLTRLTVVSLSDAAIGPLLVCGRPADKLEFPRTTRGGPVADISAVRGIRPSLFSWSRFSCAADCGLRQYLFSDRRAKRRTSR